MAITTTPALTHWNYFLALEADLANLSRYVEFVSDNYGVYSIEMAHLLLASASEVDVVLKQLCTVVAPDNRAQNIDDFRKILCSVEPSIAHIAISLPRFGLNLTPWSNWQEDKKPDWWADHNKVKHERGSHFPKANLKNVLNSMSGLFVAPRELINLAHTLGGETGLFFDRKNV